MCEFFLSWWIKRIFTQPFTKEGANFADFQQSKHIFTQPVAKKDTSFAEFQWYNGICTQLIAKKKKNEAIYFQFT